MLTQISRQKRLELVPSISKKLTMMLVSMSCLFYGWLSVAFLQKFLARHPSSPRSHKPGTAARDAKLAQSANIYFFLFLKRCNKFSRVKWLRKQTLEH
jgi:hypothetical protein